MSSILSWVETGALVLAVAFFATAAIDVYVRWWARDDDERPQGPEEGGEPPAQP